MRSITLFAMSLVIASIFAACSQGETTPPHYGVFLVIDKEYVEIPVFKGDPDSTTEITQSPETQPLIAYWIREADLNLLTLAKFDVSGSGRSYNRKEDVEFQVSPRDDGLFELRASSPLPGGVYCLVQGDWMLPPTMIQHWCFEVQGTGNGIGLSLGATNSQGEASADKQPIGIVTMSVEQAVQATLEAGRIQNATATQVAILALTPTVTSTPTPMPTPTPLSESDYQKSIEATVAAEAANAQATEVARTRWKEIGRVGDLLGLDASNASKTKVRDIAFGHDGSMWFGTECRGGCTEWGVKRLMPDGTVLGYPMGSGIASELTTSIAVAPDGSIWFGCDDRQLAEGVSRLDPDGTWTTFTADDGLGSDQVFDIAISPDNSVWFATASGISRYNQDGTWANLDDAILEYYNKRTDGLPIKQIAFYLNGDVWFSAGGYEHRPYGVRMGRITASGEIDFLSESLGTIVGFETDKNGVMWLVQNEELLLLSDSEMTLPRIDGRRDFERFDIAMDSHGFAWIGTDLGVVRKNIDDGDAERFAVELGMNIARSDMEVTWWQCQEQFSCYVGPIRIDPNGSVWFVVGNDDQRIVKYEYN